MRKSKRDRPCPPFVRLEKGLILKRREWWDLSTRARSVYLLVKAKYNGANNGAIRLYYSESRKLQIRGLKSPKDISRAFAELEREGWIRRTRFGGLYRFVCEYGLTGRFDTLL